MIVTLMLATLLAQESSLRLVKKADMEITDEARLARLDGSVSLEMTVDEQGVPRSLRVLRPLGLDLDDEAVRVCSQWRFEPASGRGAVTTKATAQFVIGGEPIDWRLDRATFDIPPGASRPHVVAVEFPAPENKNLRASVALSFDVGEDGAPANFHVESSSDARWEPAVIAAAKQWRFRPATKGDSPVAVRGTFEFVHGPRK